MQWRVETASILGYKMQKIHSWACLTNHSLVLAVELDGFRKFSYPLTVFLSSLRYARPSNSISPLSRLLQFSTWICIPVDVVLCNIPLLWELLSQRSKRESWTRSCSNSCKCCPQHLDCSICSLIINCWFRIPTLC